MKILAIDHERDGVTQAELQPYLVAEARRVWQLYQADILREIYFKADRTGVVLVLDCADETEARTHLDSLPLAQAGLITFEIIPLIPYPGFERLFSV
jgi:hypothetical protein